MTSIIIALALAVAALMWFAAKPHTTNHAANDETTSRGGFTNGGNDEHRQ